MIYFYLVNIMNLSVEHVLMLALVFCVFYYLKNRCGCKEGIYLPNTKRVASGVEAKAGNQEQCLVAIDDFLKVAANPLQSGDLMQYIDSAAGTNIPAQNKADLKAMIQQAYENIYPTCDI
jgi:hypothetical protein